MPFADPDKQKEAQKAWDKTNHARLKEYHKEYRQRNKEKYAQSRDNYRQKQIAKVRAWFEEYQKTMKCACGETHISCLDFHHRDPSTKRASVREMMRGHYPFEALLEEVEKCDVICANCHRKLHWSERMGKMTEKDMPKAPLVEPIDRLA